MASSSPLADLTENFFLCSICLDQFKEPKLLPCLHRYCRDCLDKTIQASNGRTFKCPICKTKCEMSEDGVHGFKTDFHMKSMLEFIQLQKSFEDKDLKQCASCSKKLEMSVYCLKCKKFLCNKCGEFHISLKDHKQHIIKLENYENQNMSLETCQHHAEQEASLCCGTCGNVPVCVTCVYGKHKGHDLHDVVEEAERQRKSLEQKLIDINKHKDKLYELPNIIEKSLTKLKQNVRNESKKINLQLEQQVEKIKQKVKQTKAEREQTKESIKTRQEKAINEMRRNHEEEMKQVLEKYDQEFNNADEKHDQMMKELRRKSKSLDSNIKKLTVEKEEKSKQKEIELQTISEYCKQLIERYENFTATTSSILASNDKWADAQGIPDIIAGSERLLEEMKKEYPDLESLSNFKISDLSNALLDVVTIIDRSEPEINVAGFKTNDFMVDSLSSCSDGNMVITGRASKGYSHITVINRHGKTLQQKRIKHPEWWRPWRYCCRLSEVKVITVCPLYDIAIYDVRDGSYNSKNINKIIPNSKVLTCVTTDPVNNQIIVGTTGRDLHVFDDQLNFIKTIQLPDEARYPIDISVHEGNILVCCDTRSAYVVIMTESSSYVMCEFSKPYLGGGNWKPFSVRTDKKGLIYMLWRTYNSDPRRHILLQYSQDGRQILAQIQVDENTECMTTTIRNEAELLVVAPRDTGKLYPYRLIMKTEDHQ